MIQSADIAGRYNTVVQVVGDGNTVVAGRAHLELYLPPKVESPQGIELLDPKSRAIPFIGREAELKALRAWLGSEKPVAVRVLTGGAGAGKTRLALHLCGLAQADRWDAGFVDSSELTRFRSQQNLASWDWQRPTLIVIDYAALHAQQIQDWLRELGQRTRRNAKPLRLLLLERFAEPGQGWWQTAFGRGSFGLLAIQRMLDPPEPIPLYPVNADEGRAILDATFEQAGSPLRAPKEGESAVFERQMKEMGEPLFLIMAGLRAADTGITSALSLNKTELALDLANRELERIERTAQAHGVAPAMLVQLAAYVTLCRGLTTQAAIDAARNEQAALGYNGASPAASLIAALVAALPGTDGAIAPIQPDTIGEAFVLNALSNPQRDGSGAVSRACRQQGLPVVAFAIRTAQDFGGPDYRQPLAWLDALIGLDVLDVLQSLSDALPQSSAVLVSHTVKVREALVAKLQYLSQTKPEARIDLAVAVEQLASALRKADCLDSALHYAHQAVTIWRDLTEQNLAKHLPHLAASKRTLSDCLAEIGQASEALENIREALSFYEQLVHSDRTQFWPDYASSLSRLANRLFDLRMPEAVEACENAIKAYRQLADEEPTPCQASSWNAAAVILGVPGCLLNSVPALSARARHAFAAVIAGRRSPHQISPVTTAR